MKTSKKLLPLQKIAAVFIITGSIITIGRILNLIDNANEAYEDVAAYISLIGFILYLWPLFLNKMKNKQKNVL
ncbi:hypothetical protein GTQ40_16165 [Flavobacteriaceae bacterium R38]|nr:hypothetical protein [Flavobacteriaceae bacterium R38]